MSRKKRDGEKPGSITVYANPEGVTMAIHNSEDDIELCLTITPEYARMLAQRLTMASIKVEEHFD